MRKKYVKSIFEIVERQQLNEVNIENERKNEIAEEIQDFFSDFQEKQIYKFNIDKIIL